MPIWLCFCPEYHCELFTVCACDPVELHPYMMSFATLTESSRVSCEEMLVLQEALCPVKWYLSCSLLPAIVINNFLPVPTAAQQEMIPQCDEEQWWRLWFKCLAVKLRYSGGLKKAKLRGAPCILTSGATIGGLALWMSTLIEWFLYKVVDSGGCHNSLSFF